ncbi:unnamed protein product, partial [Heterotrigona itama]
MGKVYSYITRPIRSFNIENRTAHILERKKPIPAPQYPSVEKQKELITPTKQSHRPLPQDRSQYSLDEISKSIVPVRGKCTINQIIEFITKHEENEVKYSIEKISQDYKIDKKTV